MSSHNTILILERLIAGRHGELFHTGNASRHDLNERNMSASAEVYKFHYPINGFVPVTLAKNLFRGWLHGM